MIIINVLLPRFLILEGLLLFHLLLPKGGLACRQQVERQVEKVKSFFHISSLFPILKEKNITIILVVCLPKGKGREGMGPWNYNS